MNKKDLEILKNNIVYDSYGNNDLPRYYIVDRIRYDFESGGQQYKSIGHVLVCIPKNAKKQSDLYFFESDKEKVDYYEKLSKE